MHAFKSGDQVVLKSGGPVMTIDTVNTDIFDDDKITGVLCVWFVGNKLERVRFDHRAIDAVEPQTVTTGNAEYAAVLDGMMGAMNTPADQPETVRPTPRRRKATTHAVQAEQAPPPGA